MLTRPRALEFDVTVDRNRAASSALGGSALLTEDEWWAEHLVLAGLLRCTLTSLDYSAGRAGVSVVGSGIAHGKVAKRENDGLYAFVDIETMLEVDLAPAPHAVALTELVARAERGCFVSNSLVAKPRHRWVVNGQEVS